MNRIVIIFTLLSGLLYICTPQEKKTTPIIIKDTFKINELYQELITDKEIQNDLEILADSIDISDFCNLKVNFDKNNSVGNDLLNDPLMNLPSPIMGFVLMYNICKAVGVTHQYMIQSTQDEYTFITMSPNMYNELTPRVKAQETLTLEVKLIGSYTCGIDYKFYKILKVLP